MSHPITLPFPHPPTNRPAWTVIEFDGKPFRVEYRQPHEGPCPEAGAIMGCEAEDRGLFAFVPLERTTDGLRLFA